VTFAGGNNFNDFPENQLSKFQQIFMAPPYQISDWYGGRHTCHTASGATKTGCDKNSADPSSLLIENLYVNTRAASFVCMAC